MKIFNLTAALLVAFLLTSFTLGHQPRADVLVKTDIYTIHYSEVLREPVTVDYVVQCSQGNISRAGMVFVTNDSIITSTDADYVKNEWDKGHMAPAADFNCDKKKLLETFTYINCALQHQNLNRGVWRLLEMHERSLASKGTTTVHIDVHFSSSSKKLSSGATIPDGFTKIIKVGTSVEKYYFPNTNPTRKTYEEYKQ